MMPCKTTSPRFMICKIFTYALVLLIVWVMQAIYLPELIYGDSLILTWQGNGEHDLAGYTIYCSSSQLDHDLVADLGNVTACDLNDLVLYENIPYVMALTAYDRSGNESDFSDPLHVTLDDEIADFEDNCPDIYNPYQEDIYPPGGNGIGDVCETTLTTSSSTTIPPPASTTTIPRASTTTIPSASSTTTIPECEVDTDCPTDGLYCNGDEICDKDNAVCASTGNPCAGELICDEATDECRPVESPGTLQFTPEAWYQSRWVTQIVFLSIKGFGSHFDRTLTEITFNPSNAVIMMPLVIDETTINGMGILMPRWWAPVDSIEVTVTTGAEEVTEAMKIKHLPFRLELDENPLREE